MGMYPSTAVTFVSKVRANGTVGIFQYPRETRRSGNIGTPMGTSAIGLMVGSRRALMSLPLTLGQPSLPLNRMIEGN